MTKFAPYLASKLIAGGKLTFDERIVVDRVLVKLNTHEKAIKDFLIMRGKRNKEECGACLSVRGEHLIHDPLRLEGYHKPLWYLIWG